MSSNMPAASSNTIELAPGVTAPRGVLHFRFSRSGGPGGQHVNKVSTRATLTVYISDLEPLLPDDAAARLRRIAGRLLADDRLVISAAASRSQHANRKACLEKLRDLLVRAKKRPRRRKPTRPSAAAIRKQREQKQQRGKIKRSRRTDREPPTE